MTMLIRGLRSHVQRAGAQALVALLLLAGGLEAAADEGNLLSNRFQFGLGTFINDSSLRMRLDGEAGELGTPVNWARTIGDTDATRFRFDGLWRITERHHLRVMYTDYSSTGTRGVESEIIWDGDVIPVGVSVSGTFGFEVLEAAYEYAFVRRPSLEVSGSVGAHYTQLEASLVAQVLVGGTQGTEERGGTADVDAPLPVLGVRGLWGLGGDWYLDMLGQAFYLSVGDYDGRILNWRALLLWQFAPRVGLGLGYDWFRVDIDGDDAGFRGTMDWTYEGPQVFLNVAF